MKKESWHIWSSPNGYHTPPERLKKEHWKRIHDWPHENSADGKWRQYDDQEGRAVLVLVKL